MKTKVLMIFSLWSVFAQGSYGYYDQHYGAYSCGVSSGSNNSSSIIVPVVASAAVIGTAAYMMMRETNQAKMDRAAGIISGCQNKFDVYLRQFASQDTFVQGFGMLVPMKSEITYWKKQIDESHRELSARYDSWVKPWNWSNEMKQSLKDISLVQMKVSLLNMLCKYSSCYNKQEADIIKTARCIAGSSSHYPIMDMVKTVESDMRTVQYYGQYITMTTDLILEFFADVQATLLGSELYAQECQKYQEAKLHAERIEIERIKALAQHSQACAQQSQANALHEANRIKRNK